MNSFTMLRTVALAIHAGLGIAVVVCVVLKLNRKDSYFISLRNLLWLNITYVITLYFMPTIAIIKIYLPELSVPCLSHMLLFHLGTSAAMAIIFYNILRLTKKFLYLTRVYEIRDAIMLNKGRSGHRNSTLEMISSPTIMNARLGELKTEETLKLQDKLEGARIKSRTAILCLLNICLFFCDPANLSHFTSISSDDDDSSTCSSRSVLFPFFICYVWMFWYWRNFSSAFSRDFFFIQLSLRIVSVVTTLAVAVLCVCQFKYLGSNYNLLASICITDMLLVAVLITDFIQPISIAVSHSKVKRRQDSIDMPTLFHIMCLAPLLKSFEEHLWKEWSAENIYFYRDCVFIQAKFYHENAQLDQLEKDIRTLAAQYVGEKATTPVNLGFSFNRKFKKILGQLDERKFKKNMQIEFEKDLPGYKYFVGFGLYPGGRRRRNNPSVVQGSMVGLSPESGTDLKTTARRLQFKRRNEAFEAFGLGKKPVSYWYSSFQRALMLLTELEKRPTQLPPNVTQILHLIEQAKRECYNLMTRDALLRFLNRKDIQKLEREEQAFYASISPGHPSFKRKNSDATTLRVQNLLGQNTNKSIEMKLSNRRDLHSSNSSKTFQTSPENIVSKSEKLKTATKGSDLKRNSVGKGIISSGFISSVHDGQNTVISMNRAGFDPGKSRFQPISSMCVSTRSNELVPINASQMSMATPDSKKNKLIQTTSNTGQTFHT